MNHTRTSWKEIERVNCRWLGRNKTRRFLNVKVPLVNFKNGNKNRYPFYELLEKKVARFYLANLNWLLFNRKTSQSIDFYILRVLCHNYMHFICTEFGKFFAVDFVLFYSWYFLILFACAHYFQSNLCVEISYFILFYLFLLAAVAVVWICFTQMFFYRNKLK